MSAIIVRTGGPDSRERARDRILSRLCAAAAHSISKRGRRNSSRNSAGYQPLRRRAGGIDDRTNLRAGNGSICQFLPASKFIPTFRGVGSLIPGLARVHLRQKSPRCIAKLLQDFILSAGRTGLARGFDGHEPMGRKIGNVRKHSGEIRNERR